jgi:hypothetical protein
MSQAIALDLREAPVAKPSPAVQSQAVQIPGWLAKVVAGSGVTIIAGLVTFAYWFGSTVPTRDEMGKRFGHVEDRVGAIERSISKLEGVLRVDLKAAAEAQEQLEKRMAAAIAVAGQQANAEVTKLRTDLEKERAQARQLELKTAELERRVRLTRVVAVQDVMFSKLGGKVRSVPGTILAVVSGERVLTVEDFEGATVGFHLPPQVPTVSYCNDIERPIPAGEIRKGTPVLVLWDPTPKTSGVSWPKTATKLIKYGCPE